MALDYICSRHSLDNDSMRLSVLRICFQVEIVEETNNQKKKKPLKENDYSSDYIF